MMYTLEKLESRGLRRGECLVWQGALAGKGYGVVSDDRERYVHRLVLLLTGRALQPGQQAAHSCGNPACFEASHLRPSTQSENERDKIAHGRNRRGIPGVTHCGKYLEGRARCKRAPHDGPCKPEIFEITYEREGLVP